MRTGGRQGKMTVKTEKREDQYGNTYEQEPETEPLLTSCTYEENGMHCSCYYDGYDCCGGCGQGEGRDNG